MIVAPRTKRVCGFFLPSVKLSSKAAVFGAVEVFFEDSLLESLWLNGQGLTVRYPHHCMVVDRAILQDAHQAFREGELKSFHVFVVVARTKIFLVVFSWREDGVLSCVVGWWLKAGFFCKAERRGGS